MLRNCKGFILADYFLALSIWALISMTLIPIFIHVQKQFLKSEEQREINELFYHYLIDQKLEEFSSNESVLEGNGKQYPLTWREKEEVCVSYEDMFHQDQTICEKVYTENQSPLSE
ncbi:hypothetical protein [Bacillus sp. B1-b2]|uniref:hypothetical protein n=1 Tax=Bacillus sp. B1-b2 TaxID=2653201 RepID=UPI001261702F|nr:hypothetical protein [Bacillus sp. B1-b2]KAB7670017.1 hypothetical protein F9279_09785 [Bacillus sp. B1-b2]